MDQIKHDVQQQQNATHAKCDGQHAVCAAAAASAGAKHDVSAGWCWRWLQSATNDDDDDDATTATDDDDAAAAAVDNAENDAAPERFWWWWWWCCRWRYDGGHPKMIHPSPQNQQQQQPGKEDPFAQFGVNAFRS